MNVPDGRRVVADETVFDSSSSLTSSSDNSDSSGNSSIASSDIVTPPISPLTSEAASTDKELDTSQTGGYLPVINSAGTFLCITLFSYIYT